MGSKFPIFSFGFLGSLIIVAFWVLASIWVLLNLIFMEKMGGWAPGYSEFRPFIFLKKKKKNSSLGILVFYFYVLRP